jgi:hypothetical protein
MDMHIPRVFMATLILLIFTLPTSVQGRNGDDIAAPAARGEYDQSKFMPYYDAELKKMTVSDSYANASFNISIPSNSTISAASVDLEGRPMVLPTSSVTCDFLGGGDANYKAYKGTYTTSIPGSTKPSNFSGTEFVSYEYTQIAQLDGTVAMSYAYSGEYGYHHFAFKLPFDITANVTVEWTGRGGYPYSQTYPGSFGVFLWNNASSSWETVGTGSGTTYQTVIQKSTGSGYIDQNHIVHVLAICMGSTQYLYSIMTDYVRVSVDGNQLSWAKNPQLSLGSRSSPAWKLTEEKFNYGMTVDDLRLMSDIQELVKNRTTQYVEIKVRLTSDTAGVIRISNFKVSYTSPAWCKGIPSIYHLNEDEPVKGLIELNQYWWDDVWPLKLTYNISWQENTKLLIANISSEQYDTHHLDFRFPSIAKNWHGKVGFRVGAVDTDGLYRESNTFYITVDPINDPPVITPINRQVATQGVPFNMTVKATDVDMVLDPTAELTFTDNSSLFNIDPLTGEILFTPTQEQVGVYDIEITVTDNAEEPLYDIKNFTLEVKDAEDPPILDPIPELEATEDIPFSYTVTAFDPDLPYGDELTFCDDSPVFDINSSTGIIDFTPTVGDIGIHTVTITIADRAGVNASQQFTLTVWNSVGTTDHPPSVEPIPNQTAREGEQFELSVNASDPDIELGDALTFTDNSLLFDISGRTGKISFKPGPRDAGTFKIKITVKDRDSLTATAEFWLTVIKTNHPPVVSSILPKDGAKVSQNKRIVLSAQASDLDGDTVNYTWMDGDNLLGYGSDITVIFRDRGTYIITLTVSDGKSQQSNETTLEVVEQSQGSGGNGLPGFGTVMATAAVAAAILALAKKRRR